MGAGPGDPGLFTVKGQQVLAKAQVVVYDALVGQSILNQIPESAKRINVGKRSSHHLKHQYEINQVLVDEALKGYRVVRLKGGDPFVFGRGGEEAEALRERGIPYEVVPGVTSAVAVPAYNGIPVTHRDFCSSLHIITGHKKQGDTYDIDFEALVRTKGTLIFLMGVTALPDICRSLWPTEWNRTCRRRFSRREPRPDRSALWQRFRPCLRRCAARASRRRR